MTCLHRGAAHESVVSVPLLSMSVDLEVTGFATQFHSTASHHRTHTANGPQTATSPIDLVLADIYIHTALTSAITLCTVARRLRVGVVHAWR